MSCSELLVQGNSHLLTYSSPSLISILILIPHGETRLLICENPLCFHTDVCGLWIIHGKQSCEFCRCYVNLYIKVSGPCIYVALGF